MPSKITRTRTWGYVIISLAILLFGLFCYRLGRQIPGPQRASDLSFNTAQIGLETEPVTLGGVFDATKVVEKVGPSVAQINTLTERVIYDYFRRPYLSESQGLGSGVVIAANGYILTNNHVIANASTIEVVLPGRQPARARLVGADPQTDLAVIQIDASDLPVAEIGDSRRLKVGQPVVAIGNPYGFDNTVTTGVISALNRSLALNQNTWLEGLLQTDASINPGNSGGPLLDAEGRVIGINTAIIEQAQGIGFAIPIHLAIQVADHLIKYGKVLRLGVFVETLTPELAKQLREVTRQNIPEVAGALIIGVQPNTPAATAGLRPGDVIVELNGRKVASRDDLITLTGEIQYRDRITLKVYRGSRQIQLQTIMQ
ncbi:MAG: PDZ domain-containing protein [Firmicutes bacterium]|nr:PDZ domain-containing protein [Bacillota bacterium]